MTGLSTRGIAALLEREARARGRLDLRTAVDWLRELGVPDDRIRAGLALALAVNASRSLTTTTDAPPS